MSKVSILLKRNIVTIIAFVLALISCIFVPFDKGYLNYFNVDTLCILLMTMIVIAGFKKLHAFEILADLILKKVHNLKLLIFTLVGITFFGSMVLANDMALLTFIPLTICLIDQTEEHKYAPFIITMQVIAANLGGMLTPFGNPQNMYIYSFYHVDPLEFMSIMVKPFLVSVALIVLTILIVKNKPIKDHYETTYLIDKKRIILNSILFVFALVVVFRVIPTWIGLLIVLFFALISDYKCILRVDYGLLLTFCFFFVFAGNMARIPEIKSFINSIFSGRELLVSTLSCQFISNVPSSILLSQFTSDYSSLLQGVNIGGLGTIIASLASLIALKQYVHRYHKYKGYLLTFEIINFAFLAVLLIVCLF